MREPIFLGDWDAAPDVCQAPEGWLVAGVPIAGGKRQPLKLQWHDRLGTVLAHLDVYTGTEDGGVNPRLVQAGERIWLAHRAIVDTVMQATLREIVGHNVRQSWVLGPADGPMALSGDYVAWQDIRWQKVFGRRLTIPLLPQIQLRHETRPTGLSRMDGAQPVFIDEDRLSVPGMLNPVRVFGLVVGEGPTGGIVVRTGEGKPRGTLLAGQICGTPRGARNDDGEYAAVCWGGPGARLVLFSAGDLTT